MSQPKLSDLEPTSMESIPMTEEEINSGGRSKTGYVGLANQEINFLHVCVLRIGATCYLNSLLQCLYMTPEFRHAIFHWTYRPPPDYQQMEEFMHLLNNEETATSNKNKNENENNTVGNYFNSFDDPPEYCIPYQLQCLFGRLKLSSRGATSTKPLTNSFHWDSYEHFQQQDVQELMRVLFDAVDRTFARVGQVNFLNKLCRGTLLDYLDCQDCHSEKYREDSFLDLSL
ncbi:hypothetical protein RFI_27185, partial [Reticulomyxa filosa]